MALASISIDLINNVIGPTTARQPFNLDGRIQIGGSGIAYLTVRDRRDVRAVWSLRCNG